ncbi:hypothetical protein AAVH_12812 [Aphelenchoides avenae]|nr:hypothetical protein AAVH_12812 [Aphelenchus avenae]
MPVKRSAFDELSERLKAKEDACAKIMKDLKESDAAENGLECLLKESKQELAHTKQAYESVCSKNREMEERCERLQTALQAAKHRNERSNRKL